MRRHRKLFLAATAILVGGCADSPPQSPTTPSAEAAAALAPAGELRYAITDLGTLPGGSFSEGGAVAINGIVVGISDSPDGWEHAVLWSRGRSTEIGPKGVNSGAFGVNAPGQVEGLTEVATRDPLEENFCGYGTGLLCRPFLWQNGALRLLPLLGGNNGTVGDHVNQFGQVPGAAETAQRLDASCPAGPTPNGTGPQKLVYKPVIWGPQPNAVRELGMLPGDNVGMALWVNDLGQAAGVTGTCHNTLLPPFVVGGHAVLWERDGTPVNLGSLGGSTDLGGFGLVAFRVNNLGQVVGISPLAGNETIHGFLWTRAGGMRSLDPLPGQPQSAALGLNDRGDVVGASGSLPFENPTAVIWRVGGAAADLNELVAGPTSLYLLSAGAINDLGEIVGMAFDTESEEVHAFLATPVRGNGVGPKLPKPARLPRLPRRWGFGR